MSKVIDWKGIFQKVQKLDYIDARRVLEEEGVNIRSVVKREDFQIALKIRAIIGNPADYGLQGKVVEAQLRIEDCSSSWLAWREFFAHKVGKTDTVRRRGFIERKTGAGDWFTAQKAATYDEAIAAIRACERRIEWITEYFEYRGTFSDLMAKLENYNGKGLATWLPESKAELTENGVLLRLQTWNTSKKKIAFLETLESLED